MTEETSYIWEPPAELVAACERVAHIPIAGDSLNAATAAAIALYEMTRVPAA